MLKIFRNIRQSFLIKGNIPKYLTYAIGEIILVMIGILLALQVNSWNQNRVEIKEERKLLANVHHEFLDNKVELTNIKDLFNQGRIANTELMQLIGRSSKELGAKNLDSLFFYSFPAGQFSFSDNSVDNIIQSGKLNIIRNEEFIELIHRWESLKEHIRLRETQINDWVNDNMFPYLLDYISFKEMDSYGGMPWTGESRLKPDYYILFQQLKFENLLDNLLWTYEKNYERYEEADTLIARIIEVTEPYVN